MIKHRILITMILAILTLSLAGCKKPNFGVRVLDDLNVEIIAENASKDMTGAAGSFEIAEGQ